ncbi:DUF6973 domain-containing protein [Paenibacillus donghaensis]|uniref:DUF6973 domain-containing protein n=1 Tax=Paenibacillus donghaensis TaxID=414771 RepID=A0A2Z2KWU2_9BACL|nr:hypothetical protein [Paenibacillus donghaensis]ASA25991.1 hypothetical protein B9T62_37955 [Paenibacillus donghaensis]
MKLKNLSLNKAITLSVLSVSLLLPGTSFANVYETKEAVSTSFASIVEVASNENLEIKKNEIKALLEANGGSSQNFDELIKYTNQGDIEFIYSIIELKKANPQLSPEEIVELVFPVEDSIVQARGQSSSGWNSLTTAEKWLVAGYPAEALIVNAAKNNTDEITSVRYPGWTDGDKGNAFRHALWNAIMALNITKVMAEQFASAHEDVGLTNAELSATTWNGYNGLQHKQMDLHNNQKGRDCVSWYEIPFAVTNTDLANRVQAKMLHLTTRILIGGGI